METSPESTASTVPPSAPKPPAKHGCLPHGCGLWVFGGFLLFVLAGLLIPMGGSTCVKGSQTKALAQAKQIGLALRLFAADHEGNFPRQGVPTEIVNAPKNSNQAFACLLPTYCQSERIFGNKLSAYQHPPGPDDRVDPEGLAMPVQTLRPGENVYSYVMGLKAEETPEAPLVLDGTDGTGHYNMDPRQRGGVWGGGKRAVVIHVDNSGRLENLAGPDGKLFIAQDPERKANLLENLKIYGQDVRLLDPAVPSQSR